MSPPERPPLDYKSAGVDIDAGNALVERIKLLAAATTRNGVAGGLGGFGALFRLADAGYREPLLVATTDGVGTKLKIATAMNRHDTIGIDLVAMCVNDIVVQGAEPLFFLDYFAASRLQVEQAAEVIRGIAYGCELAGAALVGGETAEMPDMYAPGDYDLAGFCVGAVEADRLIDGSRVRAGDIVLGLGSDGVHSNGFSLIRRIVQDSQSSLDTVIEHRPLGEILLQPTRIYVRPLLKLLRNHAVHAMAHITGGGLLENLPRVLPAGLGAELDARRWTRAPIFDWLRERGRLAPAEMLRTFNCGIGLTLVVPPAGAEAVARFLSDQGESVFEIGSIREHDGGERIRIRAFA